MKASFKLDNRSSYLDVTEFILKECSPLLKPTSPKTNFNDQVSHDFFAYSKFFFNISLLFIIILILLTFCLVYAFFFFRL